MGLEEPATKRCDERAVIRRARGGDLSAFETLIRRHQDAVHRWLIARSPPGIDVDDVLQHSLLTAFTRLGVFDGRSAFATWLTGIAHNCLRNAIRTQRRQRTVPLGATRQALEDAALGDTAADDRELQALRRCLARLGEAPARVIREHYAEGRPVAAIADAMARPVGSIKRQLHEARKALGRCIRHHLAGEETVR